MNLMTNYVTPIIPDGLSNGNRVQIDIDSCPFTWTYDGTLPATATFTYNQQSYTQTYTNDGTHITASTGWVLQA